MLDDGHFAVSVGQPGAYRRALALILRMTQYEETWPASPCFQQARRGVAAAGVDDHHFLVGVRPCCHPTQQLLNSALFIVDGDEDG